MCIYFLDLYPAHGPVEDPQTHRGWMSWAAALFLSLCWVSMWSQELCVNMYIKDSTCWSLPLQLWILAPFTPTPLSLPVGIQHKTLECLFKLLYWKDKTYFPFPPYGVTGGTKNKRRSTEIKNLWKEKLYLIKFKDKWLYFYSFVYLWDCLFSWRIFIYILIK